MPKIFIRFVNFGTKFSGSAGVRTREPFRPHQETSKPDDQPATLLFANEVAVDVGGELRASLDPADPFVLDHHFAATEQFASATAAVLGHGELVRSRLAKMETIWIVTHTAPDFDAFCSAWMIRACLAGKFERDFSREEALKAAPGKSEFPRNARDASNAALLLAHYASRVDTAKLRDIRCPRLRAIHTVFYAALARRDWWNANGLTDFFDEVFALMVGQGLNPFFDNVFASGPNWQPELGLIDNQEQAYQRDLRKARITLASLPQNTPFDTWYKQVSGAPFYGPETTALSVNPAQTGPFDLVGQGDQLVDALFIRDPECLFFKEWVRLDLDNSSLGRGFLFTAIAYSNARAKATTNTTDYFFSLNPETANGLHLYPAWVRLQEKQGEGIRSGRAVPTPKMIADAPRTGYGERAGKRTVEFADPWFDAPNYACTLVATPNCGAWAPPGSAPDLSDDPVANTVLEVLEGRFFKKIETWDFSTQSGGTVHLAPKSVSEAVQQARISTGSLRFCRVKVGGDLSGGLDVHRQRIAEMVWPILTGSRVAGEFADPGHHIVPLASGIVVWNRRGILVCHGAGSAGRDGGSAQPEEPPPAMAKNLRETVEQVAKVLGKLRALEAEIRESPAAVDSSAGLEARLPQSQAKGGTDVRGLSAEWARTEARLQRSRTIRSDVLSMLVSLKFKAAQPEGLVTQRFLEEINFENVLESVDTLNEDMAALADEKANRRQEERDKTLQLILALGTAIGLVFSWNQVENLALGKIQESTDSVVRFLLGLGVAALFFWVYWRKSNDGQK